jgi:hypothetical protein
MEARQTPCNTKQQLIVLGKNKDFVFKINPTIGMIFYFLLCFTIVIGPLAPDSDETLRTRCLCS